MAQIGDTWTQRFTESYRQWEKSQEELKNIVKQLMDLKNKLSFLTTDKSTVFDNLMKMSRARFGLEQDVVELTAQVRQKVDARNLVLNQLSALLLSLEDLSTQDSDDSGSDPLALNRKLYADGIRQIQQQSLLEMCIIDEVCQRGKFVYLFLAVSRDKVTLTHCFER